MTGAVGGLLEPAGSFLLTIVGFDHFAGFTGFFTMQIKCYSLLI